jgi:hypothetical protein
MASVIGPISAALKAVTGLLQNGAGAISSALGLLAAPLLAVSGTAGALGPLVGGAGGESAMHNAHNTQSDSASANVTNHADVVVALEPSLAEAPAMEVAAPKSQLQFEQFNGGVRHMRRSRVKSSRVLSPKRRSSSLKRTKASVKGRSKTRSRARGTTK